MNLVPITCCMCTTVKVEFNVHLVLYLESRYFFYVQVVQVAKYVVFWGGAKGHIVGFGTDLRADPKDILEAPRAQCALEKAPIPAP